MNLEMQKIWQLILQRILWGIYGSLINTELVNFTIENSGLSSNDVRTIKIDLASRIWIGTGNGISIYDAEGFSYIDSEGGLSDNSCNDITVDSSGNIWVGTDNGLNKITGKSGGDFEIKVFTTKDGLTSNSIMSVEIDKTNNYG